MFALLPSVRVGRPPATPLDRPDERGIFEFWILNFGFQILDFLRTPIITFALCDFFLPLLSAYC